MRTAEEVKELRREVDEMRHMTEQMSELGERVDFLERLMAKQRKPSGFRGEVTDAA